MLQFDNRFTRSLPADSETRNFTRQVFGACYSRVAPTAVVQPFLIACAADVASLLGLSAEDCQAAWFVEAMGGNRILPEMDPFAMCYGGHQFGNWAGQLGDGRAINLGEVVGADRQHYTLQLKGAGPTPYSRTADGLAVLRSSIREFLCSEAMHALGIPTTRALSLVLTGEQVVRDMFYDGNPRKEPGAIVCRVAPSFVRFGNFQIFTARGDVENLRRLVDFTLTSDFPEFGAPSRETYGRWFEEVCRRTATLMVHWMRVGFVHGVMNTDNMSILGLTIDYGPYGWLEDYDLNWTPNTTDAEMRRYTFGQQPRIGLWNLAQLANALWPLIEDKNILEKGLETYQEVYNGGWQQMMAAKLGLVDYRHESDASLLADLVKILQLTETDMTLFFRELANVQAQWVTPSVADGDTDASVADTHSLELGPLGRLPAPLTTAYYDPKQVAEKVVVQIEDWLRAYGRRLQTDSQTAEDRKRKMDQVNPRFVLRNYLTQLAIDAAEQGDYALIRELQRVLANPYHEQPESQHLAEKRPDWARNRAGCSMLSCSS